MAEATSGKGFLVVVGVRRTRDDQTRLRVASQGLAQHARQFRLTIRDVVRLLVSQRFYDFAKGSERLIDAFGFIQSLTLSASL